MGETQEERIARLTGLARKVWADRSIAILRVGIHPLVNGDAWDVVEVEEGEAVLYLRVTGEEKESLDALEAALSVLAGVPTPREERALRLAEKIAEGGREATTLAQRAVETANRAVDALRGAR